MRSFAVRSAETELMDEPCGFETFRDCLADLERVNVLTLAYGPTFQFLERLRRERRLNLGRPVRILDCGSGYGDMLRRIHRWAARKGVPVELTGLDLNPWSAEAAREATSGQTPIRWLTQDVFAFDEPADLIVSSLFTHHLDDRTLVRFLAWMDERARIGWFVNDLHRLAFPYYGFALLSALMRWHPFVRHDGPVSIARAFRPDDWEHLIRRAGLAPPCVKVRRRFPFRLCVERVRS